jgi:hypothetical protein
MYMSVLGPKIAIPRMVRSTKLGKSIFEGERKTNYSNPDGALGLKPGESVRVKTAKEIYATLDTNGRLGGLGIAPEMFQYCGRESRVFKVVEKICLEHTGEVRTIKTPTVILEGFICDGSAHGGCDRSQFFFWREDWLERLPQAESEPMTPSPINS